MFRTKILFLFYICAFLIVGCSDKSTEPDSEPVITKTDYVRLVKSQQLATVHYSSTIDIGAILLSFDITGTYDNVVLGDSISKMSMHSGLLNDSTLRILISDMGPGFIPKGSNELVQFNYQGTLDLTYVEASDFNGNVITIPIVP